MLTLFFVGFFSSASAQNLCRGTNPKIVFVVNKSAERHFEFNLNKTNPNATISLTAIMHYVKLVKFAKAVNLA